MPQINPNLKASISYYNIPVEHFFYTNCSPIQGQRAKVEGYWMKLMHVKGGGKKWISWWYITIIMVNQRSEEVKSVVIWEAASQDSIPHINSSAE